MNDVGRTILLELHRKQKLELETQLRQKQSELDAAKERAIRAEEQCSILQERIEIMLEYSDLSSEGIQLRFDEMKNLADQTVRRVMEANNGKRVEAFWIFDLPWGLPACSCCGHRLHSGEWVDENRFCGSCGAEMDLSKTVDTRKEKQ